LAGALAGAFLLADAVEGDFAFGFCAFTAAGPTAFDEVFGLGFAVFGLEDDLEEGMEWSDWIKN